MGGGKPMVKIGGQTLLEQAIGRARGWSPNIILSVKSSSQFGAVDFPLVLDDAGIEGPLAGLAACLRWAGEQRFPCLLTIACDMPFLPSDLPFRLARALGENNASVAASGGHLHPVCALWRTRIVPELASYVATGRTSLHGFAGHVGHVAVEWPGSDPDPFFNINTPADLAAARGGVGR